MRSLTFRHLRPFILACFLPAPLHAQPVFIDFEDLAASPVGTQATSALVAQYAGRFGITFNAPTPLDYTARFPTFPRSGAKAIEPCYSRELCSEPIEIRFTTPQRFVRLRVGVRVAYDQGRRVLLRAFDGAGTEVGIASVSFPAAPRVHDIRQTLEWTAAEPRIRRVTVGFSPETLFTGGLAVDDLEFDSAGPPPPCDASAAPELTLHEPVSGAVVQVDDVVVRADLTSETPLTSAVLLVGPAGGGELRAVNLGLEGKTAASVHVRSSGLAPGSNLVGIEARNCRGQALALHDVTFAPIAAGARLELLGLDVLQSIQTPAYSVELVSGKRTFVRVYLRVVGTAAPIRDVTGYLAGAHSLSEAGFFLKDFFPLLRSVNTITVDSSADLAAQRADIDASLNFELPPEWSVTGLLHLELAGIDIEDIRSPLPCDGCDNLNLFNLPKFYAFHEAPTLRLRLFKIPYVTSVIGDTIVPPDRDFDLLRSWLARAYPVSRVDAPVSSTSRFGGGPPSCVRVNAWLTGIRFWDFVTGENPPPFYGMVEHGADYDAFAGCSVDTLGVGTGPAGPEAAVWDFDGRYGDWIGAHEIGHLMGRGHPLFVESDPPGACEPGLPRAIDAAFPVLLDLLYPYANGSIGHVAIDPGDAGLGIPGQAMDPGEWHDVMTYCVRVWASDYTGEGILFRLRNPILSKLLGYLPFGLGGLFSIAASAENDGLFVSGTLDLTTGETRLEPFFRVPGLELPPRPPVVEPFSIDLLDEAGGVLASHSFQPDLPRGGAATAMIAEVVPYAAGTRRIAVRKRGVDLAARAVSPNAPAVELLSPNGGEVLQEAATEVTWRGSDPDGDPLTYTLQYTADHGGSWQTLTTGEGATSYAVSLEELPGGDGGLFRVIASDGVNIGVDDSDAPFQVIGKAPRVRIVSPGDGEIFTNTQTVVFVAEAFDREDGLLDGAAIEWSSDRQGLLGIGRSMSALHLLPGIHLITVSARDRSGDVSRAMVQIEVEGVAPEANAGHDRSAPILCSTPLNARRSRGIAPLTYRWELLETPLLSGATLARAEGVRTSFFVDRPGRYVVQLTVEDALGSLSVDRVIVTGVAP